MNFNSLAFGYMFGTIIGAMVTYYYNISGWYMGIGSIIGIIIFPLIDELIIYSQSSRKVSKWI